MDSRTGQGSDEEEGEHRLVRKGTGHPGQGRKKATDAYAWCTVCLILRLMYTVLSTVEESEESENEDDESHVQYEYCFRIKICSTSTV